MSKIEKLAGTYDGGYVLGAVGGHTGARNHVAENLAAYQTTPQPALLVTAAIEIGALPSQATPGNAERSSSAFIG